MHKNENANWTPYLVPETNVLCEDLKTVQELAKRNKFIIIISLVGEYKNMTLFDIVNR